MTRRMAIGLACMLTSVDLVSLIFAGEPPDEKARAAASLERARREVSTMTIRVNSPR